jgi:hypothetical protein
MKSRFVPALVIAISFTRSIWAQPAPVDIVCGPLTMEIRVSETAHVFHIVDQLSAWSPFCHGQYARHFTELTGEDRALLAKHAELRGRKSWGQGLEQTFYTELDLEEAIAGGVRLGHLSEVDAAVEREVLNHFAPMCRALMEEEIERLEGFVSRIGRSRLRLAEFAERVERFTGSGKVVVPVYPIANPDDFNLGGGFNGGKLTLEVPQEDVWFPTFLHELMHAFVDTQRGVLNNAAKGVEGLDFQTLNEGIAYALSPGIYHASGSGEDPLRDRVAKDFEDGKSFNDSYVRSNRYGLALRPLVEDVFASDHETLNSFLPRAVDAWRVMVALNDVRTGDGVGGQAPTRTADSPPGVIVMFTDSALWSTLTARYQTEGISIWGRNHSQEHYDEMFEGVIRSKDTLILLFAPGDAGNVPQKYRRFLSTEVAEIEAILARDETVANEVAIDGIRVVTIAAPSTSELRSLVIESPLMNPVR